MARVAADSGIRRCCWAGNRRGARLRQAVGLPTMVTATGILTIFGRPLPGRLATLSDAELIRLTIRPRQCARAA